MHASVQREQFHVSNADQSVPSYLPIVAWDYPPRQLLLQHLLLIFVLFLRLHLLQTVFFSSMDSFKVFTAVTMLSSEVFCLSNATRSSLCRISSVFLTLKFNVLIFLFNSVCCYSIIAQLSRRGCQFVENVPAIHFLLKSPFNFLQIITNSA